MLDGTNSSRCIRSSALKPESVDEGSQIGIGRCKAGESFGVVQRADQISGIPVKRNKCGEGISIVRMPGHDILEGSYGLVMMASRIQRNGIYIRIPRQLGRKFRGTT